MDDAANAWDHVILLSDDVDLLNAPAEVDRRLAGRVVEIKLRERTYPVEDDEPCAPPDRRGDTQTRTERVDVRRDLADEWGSPGRRDVPLAVRGS
jgi:hypothetical protein